MANKRLNATIVLGGAISSSLRSALSTTKAGLTGVGDSVRRLAREQKMLGDGIQTFGRMGKNVDGLRVKYAAVTAELNKQRTALQRLKSLEDARARNAARMSSMAGMVGAVVASAATLGAPIVQAVKFETAMLGVAKQMDGARDASGKLTPEYHAMGKAIQQLGRTIPLSTNELAEMTTAGLRMGVAKDQVLDFVKTSAMMATAFDETNVGELAEKMGKIAGLYKIPVPEIARLGDTINYLDDNAISKGTDIIEYMTRVGGVASAVKVTSNEMAALGSTLLTLGERTETASTSTNAMFQKFAAADKGTKKFRLAMKQVGLSTTAVQKGMQTDAMGTMLKVLDAVAKLPKDQQLGVMVDLVGMEHSDTMAKLANNTDELRKQLGLANSEAAKGSMSREFQARMETTAALWEITKNRVTELSVSFGSMLLPAVNSVLGGIGAVASKLADFSAANPTLVKSIGTVAGAFLVFGAGKLAIMGVVWAFNALRIAVMTNPIGLAVTALAAGGLLIYQNWDKVKPMMLDLWNSVTTAATTAWNFMYDKFLNFTPLGLVIKNWDPIKTYFTGLFADITATAKTALEWIVGKIDAIGAAWQKTKSFFGVGDTPAAGAASAPATPKPPALATQRGAAPAGVTDNSQQTFNITQQPGEDTDALARRIAAQMDKQRQVRQRGNLSDGNSGQ